ncbi:hypothetical protein GOL93_31530, partial [Sinorhizobium medicae]|nr:hypothetical protein [Sinorhizobium medicae]
SFERQRIMLEETEVTRGLVGRYVETRKCLGYRTPAEVFMAHLRDCG